MKFGKITSNKQKLSLLLGNGFSISARSTFQYKSLVSQSNLSERIKGLIEKLKIFDFERLNILFQYASEIVGNYSDYKCSVELSRDLKSDGKSLKNELIDTITKIHPKKSDLKFDSGIKDFLKIFTDIFTTNYDLLLYWAINHEDLKEKAFKDGFSRKDDFLKWNGNDQNIHFLHGALQIQHRGYEYIKKSYRENENILDQVTEDIKENGKYPLFILEGTSEQKLKNIKEHQYLDHCYRKLESLEGELLTFGFSFSESDNHIFDAIGRSKITKIYVGIYEEEDTQEKRQLICKVKKLSKKDKEIIFFNSATVTLWRDKDKKP